MRDELDDLLGIDSDDPTQQLAHDLVAADRELLRELVAHRNRLGLSQLEVGRRMGVTQPAVAAFERADADPKLSTIRRYALAVGILVRHALTPRLTSASSLISHVTSSTTGTTVAESDVHVRPRSRFVVGVCP